MRQLFARKSYRRDIKLAHKRRKDLSKLYDIVAQIQKGQILPQKHRPHMLTGEWYGNMEGHIEPDWLLIYQVTAEELILVRTGTHSDLFN
jgi:mRNA interferase YafQ